jgi:alkylation response protein AidB-like acyl-CoA dehydrogenase
MEFGYTDAQQQLRERTVEFVQSTINPHLQSPPDPEKFDRGLWKVCADQGFLSYGMPEPWSSHTHDSLLTMIMSLESFGYACDDNGLPFSLASQGCTIQHSLLAHGSETQQKKYLPGCISGDLIGATAMTEPDAGSDSNAISMLAERTDRGYRLSGEKLMITLAPVADFCIVFATVNKDAGRWGITAFLVDLDAPGAEVIGPVPKLGLDSAPMGRIKLDGCEVAEDQRMGPEGAGAAIAHQLLEIERTCILASQVGRMKRQLEATVDYAKNRKQFGQPIAGFQAVSNRMADMRVRLENAQLLLYKTAWKIDQGESARLESSMLKLAISEDFLASSIDSMRVHGGYSYIEGHFSGRDTRDALGGVLYAGTSDIQRNIIASLLGL